MKQIYSIQFDKIFFVFLILNCLLFGCSDNSQKEIWSITDKLCIPEEDFLRIQFGMPFSKVKAILKDSLRHEFTVKVDGSVYMLTDCCIEVGETFTRQWLLFRNEILVNLPSWVPPPMEEVPYENTTWRRVRSWKIEDMTRIKKVLSSPLRGFDEVRMYLDSMREGLEKRPRSWNTALPMWLYRKTMEKKIIEDYKINLKLLKKYDGCKTKIGMSVEKVQSLYGLPLKISYLKNGRLVHIYGAKFHLEVNPELCYSNLAVEFDNDKRALRVLSRDFFNKKWLAGTDLD